MIVITDWTLPRDRLLSQLERALSVGSAVAVQHRNPTASPREFLAQAWELSALARRFGNAMFVNGRLEVALRVGAHLHLPAGHLTPADVRPHWPGDRWISAAVHNEAEVEDAAGADLALVSPVFPPFSKPDDARPALGPSGFARLARLLRIPSFALGGITPERGIEVPGAFGAAVISAVLGARDPEQAARSLTRGPWAR